MRFGRLTWLLLGLLIAVGMWGYWHQGSGHESASVKPARGVARVVEQSLSTAPQTQAEATTNAAQAIAVENKEHLGIRLSNTTKTLDELIKDPHAILLANALIDTGSPLNLSIPKDLQSTAPGAYIVQARGPISGAFRVMLAQYGAQIVSYIPNDAYLVSATAGAAGALAGNGLVQAVVPYEPYYKVQGSLLWAMENGEPMPEELNVASYPNTAGETQDALQKAGATIVDEQKSPFGEVFTVRYPGSVASLAQASAVQIIEAAPRRGLADDLSRAAVGVSADTQTTTNYLGLSGSNVLVEVNDSGIDTNHPDFKTGTSLPVRVIGTSYLSMVDTNGHGTHVAGIIAGNGYESLTVTNAEGSLTPITNYQFRGMAPLATLLSRTLDADDQTLQETAALTNALISNNSWAYDGDNDYDLEAASYDAATRDALPLVTGSQPVLFVFAAGNDGGGDDDGYGGVADTILSPGTAKDVITVGALEEFRYITNIVTGLNSNQSAIWEPETDSGDQVADFSARGNVGIGFEGTYGRYKPDVVTPGTFEISTRSEQWDQWAYYDPTNYDETEFSDQAGPYGVNYYTSLFVPENTVEVDIDVVPDDDSGLPFSTPTLYLWEGTSPYGPATLVTSNLPVEITDLTSTQLGAGWSYAVSNTVNETIGYDVLLDVITTNDLGNYYQVLSNLNDSIGPWYRYESGTSMSAANVSGVLALMQQFYSNTFAMTPSPALMKAALINGSRSEPDYDFQVENAINFQGWGLINLPDTLPAGITNVTGVACDDFFVDQSPTNALATGDSHTCLLTINTTNDAQYLPLGITLAWTDPPGDPAAGIKLVNSLELVVTNLDNKTNVVVYYGNDIAAGNTANTPESATNAPVYDVVNNVQNVFLSPALGTNYSITVVGNAVNVNAVSAQTNSYANPNGTTGVYAPNVVQDYALVVSCGEGEVTNAFTLSDLGIVSNPSTNITILNTNELNAPLFNQFVGASTPLLGTNSVLYGSSQVVTLGMTNQWHFYVVTNTLGYSNVAFLTFLPDTLSVPRMGVYQDSITNATTPEADLDLFVACGTSGVTNASAMTILDTNLMSACVNGPQVGESAGMGASAIFYGSDLGPGGTKYVVDTNSSKGEVYYIGVQSQDQMASEYAFVSIITTNPFSQMNPSNGDEIVTGNPVPVPIPAGSPSYALPGFTFGLALYPIQIQNLVVSNTVGAENFGDLVGTLAFTPSGGEPQVDVLNNHDSLGNTLTNGPIIYDDSGQTPGSRFSDGPGSLSDYVTEQGSGVWILSEANTAAGQTASINAFTMLIQPHQPLNKGVTTIGSLTNGGWYYNYIVVPAGATNLTLYITNGTVGPTENPIDLYIQYGAEPTSNNYDKMTIVSTGTPFPNSSLSIGPSDVPPLQPGIYWIGVYNPGPNTQTNITIQAVIEPANDIGEGVDFDSTGLTTILDDAVTYAYQFVPTNGLIESLNVGLVVQHPRISDLVFYLISPQGTRVQLMQNRGGTSSAGCGGTVVETNVNVTLMTTNVTTNYLYLTFTDDTNLSTIPIKFAPTPFTDNIVTNMTTTNIVAWYSGFEGALGTVTYFAPTHLPGGWDVESGSVDILSNGYDGSVAYQGTEYLDLNGSGTGEITTNIATISGATYTLSYVYTRNPDSRTVFGNVIPSANVLINGTTVQTLVANSATNTWLGLGWEPTSYVFTAISPLTSLTFQSTSSSPAGVLLDAVSLMTQFLVTNHVALPMYVQPEQSLDLLDGQSSDGLWSLEIQDDRAGAGLTNASSPTLVSWQLQFVLADTNAIPQIVAGGGIGQTNFVASNSIAWYQINVPTNATIATNILDFASLPVNVWFSTNTPPTITNADDMDLLHNLTNGYSILNTNGPTGPIEVAYIIPGGTYYLGVQNLNATTVNYAIQVNFNHGNAVGSGLPQLVIASAGASGSGTTLNWTASASAQFEVQWTDDLTQPWNTDSNVITSSDGDFTFTDDGSQTAPLGAARFYRIVEISP